MPKRYTIPAFDDSTSETRESTTIKIEGASGRKLSLLRVTGENGVRLHDGVPVDAADELNGFPLGPHATDFEYGECLALDRHSVADGPVWVTATVETEVAVLEKF